jgi:hypothetical protein
MTRAHRRRIVFAGAVAVALVAVGVAAALSFSTTGSLKPGDPTQTGRVHRDGNPSSCAGKANPGLATNTGERFYDKYSFVNLSNSSQCVTASYSRGSGSCTGRAFGVAYTTFLPASPANNYLGDGGSSVSDTNAGPQTFGFTVGAGASFDVVMSQVDIGDNCNSYVLTVSGAGIVNAGIPPLLDQLESQINGLHPGTLYHDILAQVDKIQADVKAGAQGTACADLKALRNFVIDHESRFNPDGFNAFLKTIKAVRNLLNC